MLEINKLFILFISINRYTTLITMYSSFCKQLKKSFIKFINFLFINESITVLMRSQQLLQKMSANLLSSTVLKLFTKKLQKFDHQNSASSPKQSKNDQMHKASTLQEDLHHGMSICAKSIMLNEGQSSEQQKADLSVSSSGQNHLKRRESKGISLDQNEGNNQEEQSFYFEVKNYEPIKINFKDKSLQNPTPQLQKALESEQCISPQVPQVVFLEQQKQPEPASVFSVATCKYAPSHFQGDFDIHTSTILIKNKTKMHQQNLIPPLCIINNLLSLSHLFNSDHLKRQIKRLSVKFQIPFTRLLIIFGIEKLIQIFYSEHDVELEANEQYIFQKIGFYVYKLFQSIHIKNWFILRRILRGTLNRFGSLSYYNDPWLENLLKKKKNLLQSTGVSVTALFQSRQNFAKSDESINIEQFLKEEEPEVQQKDMVDFRSKYPELALEDENNTEFLHDPEATKVNNKLKYFRKKKQQKQEHEKILQEEADQIDKNSEEIISPILQPTLLEFQISIVRSNPPRPEELIVENSAQLQTLLLLEKRAQFAANRRSDRFMVNESEQNSQVSGSNLSMQSGSKKQRMKAKKMKKSQQQLSFCSSNKSIKNALQIKQIQKSAQAPKTSNKSSKGIKKSISNNKISKKTQIDEIVLSDSDEEPSKNVSSEGYSLADGLSDFSVHMKQSFQSNEKVDIGKIIKELQEQVYTYFTENPEFGMDDLLKRVTMILNKKKVPAKYQTEIREKWLQKFS